MIEEFVYNIGHFLVAPCIWLISGFNRERANKWFAKDSCGFFRGILGFLVTILCIIFGSIWICSHLAWVP